MILPSILGTNFACIKDNLAIWKANGIQMLHFDVMDNHFVPNLTFGHQFIADLRSYTSLLFDVHLMITNPARFIPLYIQAGAQYISAHIEAFNNIEEINDIIHLCKKENVLFGLAIKPKTDIDSIKDFLTQIDFVVVMTVEPGFGGQALILNTLDKIKQLHQYKIDHQLTFKIEADGGINEENMLELKTLGVELLVMGSAFFKSNHPFDLLKKEKDYGL